MVSEPCVTLSQEVVYYRTVCVLADDKSKTHELMAPEIIRVFTEFFFIMENLAEVRVGGGVRRGGERVKIKFC